LSYQDLGEILRKLNHIVDKNLLSSFEHYEDAATYRINSEIAVIFTTDFITPIVDDPFAFGQIAAANALSDIFAMGGKPLLALNIVCFPADRLDDLEEMIKGGCKKVIEAGAMLVGGHSIKDQEPKYGLAALGLVHPEKIRRNNNCQEGDRLILTKPLGTGIIATALKTAEITVSEAQETINWMIKLNSISNSILNLSINSMTDITGFGFLGHLSEMLQGSDVGADIEANKVPLIEKALELSHKDMIPGGSLLNQKIFSCGVEKMIEIDSAKEILLYDAQTSGGLLISVKKKDARQLLKLLIEEGFSKSSIVGSIRKIATSDKRIRLI
jgi:selenide,water dikinase